jgi:hypothetical protein
MLPPPGHSPGPMGARKAASGAVGPLMIVNCLKMQRLTFAELQVFENKGVILSNCTSV